MGKLKKFLGMDSGGMDCQETEDGKLHCRKFTVDKNAKIASGSEATIAVDPQTCRAFFAGDFSVLEDDESDFDRMAKKKEQACRGGLQ